MATRVTRGAKPPAVVVGVLIGRRDAGTAFAVAWRAALHAVEEMDLGQTERNDWLLALDWAKHEYEAAYSGRSTMYRAWQRLVEEGPEFL
jgi:hypothetical protein